MRYLTCLCFGLLFITPPCAASFSEDRAPDDFSEESFIALLSAQREPPMAVFLGSSLRNGRKTYLSKVPEEQFNYDPEVAKKAYLRHQERIYRYSDLKDFYTTWNDRTYTSEYLIPSAPDRTFEAFLDEFFTEHFSRSRH